MNKRVILLPLLIAVILSLTITPGCNEDKTETAGEFTQEELKQILTDTMQSSANADSFKIRNEKSSFLNIRGGCREGSISVDSITEMVIDRVNKEMQLCGTESMLVIVTDSDESIVEETVDIYLIDDTIYANVTLPILGKDWYKMQATDEIMENYGLNQIDDTLSLLETAGEMTFLRYEYLNGEECYVIGLVPDMGKILDNVNALDVTGEQFGPDDMDIIQKLTYTCWINKETKYLEKAVLYILLKFTGEDSDAWDDETVVMMDMTIDLKIYDYNEPVDIDLPEEALEAISF